MHDEIVYWCFIKHELDSCLSNWGKSLMSSLILQEGKISIYLEFAQSHVLPSPNSAYGEIRIDIFAKYRSELLAWIKWYKH